jgi:hypothetical protein
MTDCLSKDQKPSLTAVLKHPFFRKEINQSMWDKIPRVAADVQSQAAGAGTLGVKLRKYVVAHGDKRYLYTPTECEVSKHVG